MLTSRHHLAASSDWIAPLKVLARQLTTCFPIWFAGISHSQYNNSARGRLTVQSISGDSAHASYASSARQIAPVRESSGTPSCLTKRGLGRPPCIGGRLLGLEVGSPP